MAFKLTYRILHCITAFSKQADLCFYANGTTFSQPTTTVQQQVGEGLEILVIPEMYLTSLIKRTLNHREKGMQLYFCDFKTVNI